MSVLGGLVHPEFWILDTAPAGDWAIMGTSGGHYVWVLSRAPAMAPSEKAAVSWPRSPALAIQSLGSSTTDRIITETRRGAITTTRSETHRFKALDGWRGVCAMMVVLFHLDAGTHVHALTRNGWASVDFFFVLSGFVLMSAFEGRVGAGASLRRFSHCGAWRGSIPLHLCHPRPAVRLRRDRVAERRRPVVRRRTVSRPCCSASP